MANIALARAYQQSFESHPYYTLAFTNGALNALGDAVAQLAQRLVRTPSPNPRPHIDSQQTDEQSENRRHRYEHDIPRTMRFFAFGFGMGASGSFGSGHAVPLPELRTRSNYRSMEFLP